METSDLISILGCELESTDVKQFLEIHTSFEDYSSDNDLYKINYSQGVDLLFRNKILDTVFLYSDGKDGHKQYNGSLPLDMKFSYSRQELISSNTPDKTWKIGQGEVDLNFPVPSHDRWAWGQHSISAHYSKKTGSVMYFTIREST